MHVIIGQTKVMTPEPEHKYTLVIKHNNNVYTHQFISLRHFCVLIMCGQMCVFSFSTCAVSERVIIMSTFVLNVL